MCGIAGVLDLHASGDLRHLKRMTDCLRHRGPDDEGYLAVVGPEGPAVELGGSDTRVCLPPVTEYRGAARCALGHRRLSIIDPSPGGHQPMPNGRRDVWIVYNGELYNYIELRNELKSQGVVFYTDSDTEVLLQAYERWGEECLGRLNGMWAFAILDLRRQVLFCSRDRFGVKPLYYYHDGTRFCFSSEIKALLELPFVSRTVNEGAVFSYLLLGKERHLDSELFSDVRSLDLSTALRVNLRDLTVHSWRYYELPVRLAWEGYSARTFAGHVRTVRDRVIDAVGIRLRSDVPVGSCLSGGMDSSSVVAVIDRLRKERRLDQIGPTQRVFTASYRDGAVDESRWAEIVVRATGAHWSRTYPGPADFAGDLEAVVRCQDVPFGSTSIYAQYRVMRLASEGGIKVLLDGQGGDELFTGYPPFYDTFFYEMLRQGDWGLLRSEYTKLANSPLPHRYLSHLAGRIARMHARRLLPRSLKARLLLGRSGEHQYLAPDFLSRNLRELDATREYFHVSLNEMLNAFMTRLNLGQLLRYEDRNSMHFSIESRTPFADDKELIESVFSIPSAYKIHDGWSKALLREAMRGVVPEEVRLRKDKIGFATPEIEWIRGLRSIVARHCNPDVRRLIDTDGLLSRWDHLAAHSARTGATALWRYVNFIVWQDLFEVSL